MCLLILTSVAGAETVEPLRYDAPVVRVKDMARIHGVRENQIYGLGLVVGLQGTGDGSGSRANVQMIANMLEGFGVTVSPNDLKMRNIAAVMVTADISTAVRTGDRINVTVSSIGDARSLQEDFFCKHLSKRPMGKSLRWHKAPFPLAVLWCEWRFRCSGKPRNCRYGTERSHCGAGDRFYV